MVKAAVVVPTNRPERIEQFVQAWKSQFHKNNVRLIVVEDSPEWSCHLPDWVEHYCRANIEGQLKDKASCIPTKSGGCRDFGFWLAGKDESIDMIVALDDDVLPIEDVDFLAEHWQALETPHSLKWMPLFPGFRLRGEPYSDEKAKTMLNLGLWHGFPDVDAFGQFSDPDCQNTFGRYDAVHAPRLLPVGMYAPVCGMNIAFRREVAPYYYFPKLPDGYKRFDDIWCGLIFKRIADLFGWAVSYGEPALKHDRASNPLSNLKQEMLAYGLNEEMWKALEEITRVTPQDTYDSIALYLAERFPVLKETAAQMRIWASLWEHEPNEAFKW